MPYRLRYQQSEWASHHVVSRCINGYGFMTPTPEIVQVCAGVLGRALFVYSDSIKLHCKSFLSNHFHLLLSSRDAQSLARFMQYLKSNLTRELARIHEWQGTIWQRRYSSEEILDKESFIATFKYILENSVKEGLVEHPREWRGLHSFHQLVDQQSLEGEWIDRTALYTAKKRAQDPHTIRIEDFITRYPIVLTRPSMWMNIDNDEYHKLCTQLADEAIESARSKRDLPPIGMTQVLETPALQARPIQRNSLALCRARTLEQTIAYQEVYQDFKRAYKRAYRWAREQVQNGKDWVQMVFPSGGIVPLSFV